MGCVLLFAPKVGWECRKFIGVQQERHWRSAGKALAIAGQTLVRFQGVAVGADGAIGGPFGNGISGMAFVFWKAAISHLPACFRRVSV
jgi:hypothetical protein